MRVVALDFDGVIADSARETFVVALRAMVAMRPSSRLAPMRGEAEAAARDEPAAMERLALFAGFRVLMPLGNRAEDFGVALDALEQGRSFPGQPEYDAFLATHHRQWLLEFHERFYLERERLAAAEPELWRSLQPPYPEVVAALQRHRGAPRLAIATAKDRRSVEALLEHYGLAGAFAPDLVLDKETGVAKTAHLELLQRRLGVPFSAITFVDDKLRHLDAVAPLGVRCVLAAWGYNGARERIAAGAAGHLVCAASEFEARVLGGPLL
jgi:phosphoglycolate phosphatase-like HAD superfamily hydrolase